MSAFQEYFDDSHQLVRDSVRRFVEREILPHINEWEEAEEFPRELYLKAGAFSEVILATNPTVEGEATAHYIAQLLVNKGLIASRIAHGMPLGGELELVDGGTLAHSIAGRRPIIV